MIINTDLIYPIGAIYISVSATNPAILFGGKWEAINSRFLIGTGTATGEGGETYNFTVGTVGGEYSHKLTLTEIPAHKHQIKTNNDEYVLPLDGELISKNDTKEDLQKKNRSFICIEPDDPDVILRDCCISIFGDNDYAKRLRELMFGKNTKSNTITEYNEFVKDFCSALADIAETYIYTMYKYHLSINESITELNKCKEKKEIVQKVQEILQKILYTIQFVKDYPDEYEKFNDMINQTLQNVQNHKIINVQELSNGIQSFFMNLQKKSDDIKDSLIKYLKGVEYKQGKEHKITEIQNMFIEPEDMFISDRMKREIKKQNKKLQQKQIKNDTESLFGGVKKVVSDNCNIF